MASIGNFLELGENSILGNFYCTLKLLLPSMHVHLYYKSFALSSPQQMKCYKILSNQQNIGIKTIWF